MSGCVFEYGGAFILDDLPLDPSRHWSYHLMVHHIVGLAGQLAPRSCLKDLLEVRSCWMDQLEVHSCLKDQLVVRSYLKDQRVDRNCLMDQLEVRSCLKDQLVDHSCWKGLRMMCWEGWRPWNPDLVPILDHRLQNPQTTQNVLFLNFSTVQISIKMNQNCHFTCCCQPCDDPPPEL